MRAPASLRSAGVTVAAVWIASRTYEGGLLGHFVMQACPVTPCVGGIGLLGLLLSALSWRSGQRRRWSIVLAALHLFGIAAACFTLLGSIAAV